LLFLLGVCRIQKWFLFTKFTACFVNASIEVMADVRPDAPATNLLETGACFKHHGSARQIVELAVCESMQFVMTAPRLIYEDRV
jgi:hypothetical protein